MAIFVFATAARVFACSHGSRGGSISLASGSVVVFSGAGTTACVIGSSTSSTYASCKVFRHIGWYFEVITVTQYSENLETMNE